jgi:hypothetical protein
VMRPNGMQCCLSHNRCRSQRNYCLV